MRSLPLALALCLAAPAAVADNSADESDIAFSLGNQHYAKRDYERALQQYFLSYRLVPNRNVLFNIARCYEAMDRFDEAYRYWHDLFVDPTLPDKDKRDVKAALARLGPKVALLSVTTTPPGAQLYVDREDLGSRGATPLTVAVPPGAHTVIAKRQGSRAATKKLSAARGRETEVALALDPILGTVTLEGGPEGAVVRESADAPPLGTLPATLQVPPGKHLFLVQRDGYLPAQVLLEVKPDETVSAKVQLTEQPKPTGKVVVTANRENAVVRVDGKDSGFTPVVLTLVEGEHTIEVTTIEVTPYTRTLDVKAGSETRLFAELRYAPPPVRAASKTLKSVDDAPASVTVITREELQAFGYQTVAEALQAVRGFFLADDRFYTYAGLRGFAPAGDLNTRVLVLWDGHSTLEVWAGQNFIDRGLDVDLGEIDRIEVVRGPASILFGTGAVFGVINVVPRDSLGGGRNAEARAGAGGQNGAGVHLAGALTGQDKSVVLSGAGFLAEGAPVTDLGGLGVVRGLDGERAVGASTRAKWGGLTLMGKINQRRKQIPTAPSGSTFNTPGTEYTDARGFVDARYEKQLGRLSLFARASWDGSQYRGWYASDDGAGVITRDSDAGGANFASAELRAGFSPFAGNQLSLSVEGQYQLIHQQTGRGAPYSRRTRLVVAATALDEWKVFDRLSLQAGLRVDRYDDIRDLALSPRVAAVARPYDGGLTKAVVGQAFRAPNVYEQYYQDNFLSIRAADPLKPETITTFEAEHSHDLTPELRVTLAGYFNLMDRLVIIDDEPTGIDNCSDGVDTYPCLVFQNSTGRTTALGGEVQLRWQPGRFTLVEANYSFVQLGSSTGSVTQTAPAHIASLKAMVPLKEGLVRLSGMALYQSALYDDAGSATGEAVLLNLGLSGEYGPVRYFAGVRNALDTRYGLPLSNENAFGLVPQYGRTFWVELTSGF